MSARLESNNEPLPGYRLIERLGGGGFGEVWKCEAPGGLHKAIKFVYGDLNSHEDGVQAEQELKALARVKTVRHPFILSLERYDIIDGQLIIVMELADRNLWDRFKECRARGLPGIPREELLRYVEESAEALDLMNNQYQLQHLDIKPQNIFLIHNHVKVADFGLVKDLEGLETKMTGGITPVYAAPETFDGIVSRHCDQYSLAICYQELLTGQRPFSGSNVRQLILQHIQGQPNVSVLPPAEQPIILRSLAKVPGERYPNCREMVRMLRLAGEQPAVPVYSSPEVRPPSSQGTLAQGATTERTTANEPVINPTALLARQTDSAMETTQSLKGGGDLSVLRSRIENQPLKPSSEVKGDGSLFPALVIGLGQLGLSVLRRLRERLVDSFGGMDRVGQLKLLLLDTDPDIMREACQGRSGAGLNPEEVLLAPLNRVGHYIKPREGRPPLDSWISQRTLYRIPRSQVTAGVRALGRLAFWDHYRTLMRRIQAEVERILDTAALQKAARNTGAGLRTNQPRVYLVTGLAGGTGSGIFLDLAYSLRALFRQQGYEQPDIVSVLLAPVPSTSVTGPPTAVLANTYAALSELRYYARNDTVFQAAYHEREAPIRDPEPPFTRTLILPLPEECDESANRELQDMVGQMLYRDLCTPLGRVADLARAGLPSPVWPERGNYFQTFGLYRLSWPRRELLRETARLLCLRLISRWMSKDSKPHVESIATYVKEQWRTHQLSADSYINRMQDILQESLRKDPETALLAVVEPFVRGLRAQAAARPQRKSWGQPVPQFAEIDANELQSVVEEINRLLGNPTEESLHDTHGEIGVLLRQAGEHLTNEWSQKLAEATVHLIEEPEYRLAGAEESVRQVVALLDQVLHQYDPLCREINTRAATEYEALQQLLKPQTKPLGLGYDEAIELVRSYPKSRLQSLMLHQVSQAFLALRGHLSDELREVNFCRVRLSDLQRSLEASGHIPSGSHPLRLSSRDGQGDDIEAKPEAGRVLYPAGCRTLTQSVEKLVAVFTPDLMLDLDHRMEAMIRTRFQALVNICLTQTKLLKEVELEMIETAATFVGEQLPITNVAEMFLEQTGDDDQRISEIDGYFGEAAPEMGSVGPFGNRDGRKTQHETVPSRELVVISRPADEAGETVLRLAGEALDAFEINDAAGGDDVIFYREIVNLRLAHLEQLGQAGLDAYRQMSGTDNFTPHSRADVDYTPR